MTTCVTTSHSLPYPANINVTVTITTVAEAGFKQRFDESPSKHVLKYQFEKPITYQMEKHPFYTAHTICWHMWTIVTAIKIVIITVCLQ